MESLYADKDIPFVFKNGLQTLWLSYSTNYVVNQNLMLAEYYKKFEKENVGEETDFKLKTKNSHNLETEHRNLLDK